MKKTILTLMSVFALTVQAQTLPYQNPALSPAERAADLCSRLTIEEKVSLMLDRSPAIERLGIPQFEWWNEALHGIGRNGYATVFPITMNMAASFNDALVYKVFSAASDEARAKNMEAKRNGEMARYRGLSFWTPNINIFRDPRWGRGQETYGEDPYLTTKMGLAVVRGLQGYSYEGKKPASKYAKLFACAKHYAVHSGPEWNRHSFNVEQLPERDLWETYLPAFKALVQEGDVKEIMCAYQRIDGEPCCAQTRYLHQILRDEWGFKGIVTSDCGAIRDFWAPGRHGFSTTQAESSAKAVIAGTDVECGSDYRSLPEALQNGFITEEQINTSLIRLLQARFELGDFDPDDMVEWTKIPMSVVASKEHKQLALEVAREGMTLLQNRNNILPLRRDQKIVVMGPNANDSTMLWGNYTGTPTQTVTILEGIRNKCGDVPYIQGCNLTRNEVIVSLFNDLKTPDGKKGMRATYWNNEQFEGTPVTQTENTSSIHLVNGGNTAFAPGVNLEHFSAKFEGILTPQKDADIMINLNADDYTAVIFNGDTLASRLNAHGVREQSYTQHVEAGKQYTIEVDYAQNVGMAFLAFDIAQRVNTDHNSLLQQVSDADVVIFVGGISPRLEGEEMRVNEEGFRGGDRTSIELPKVQRELIADLKRAGKSVVFVNCSGSAMGLVSESQYADAILQAWYGGEQGGNAVADVLFGDYNPSGKLPITFYQNAEQLPDFEDYRMEGRTYRYFKGEALFPFGYGLSYTTFQIGKPVYQNGKVTVSVKNTGKCAGTEVVQVYVRNPKDVDGPTKTLRAYQRVQLKASESKTVSISLPRSSFELWDAKSNTMRVVPGTYEIMVGSSSRDKDLKKTVASIR
ncbi:MAG: glycoside hydrolase family 3 C-terminal domain-containing protein [Prevotella sp.]|nr:glycoside hydrolase family 3 C-terminal domain-containing protein [Prevotella sp.]MBP5356094.1 glycoside hydrolase family 3 C-terminal domain-containing protein [Prevotella sp.]